MKKFMSTIRLFWEDDDGAAMVEYSILIGIITAAIIALIINVALFVTNSWTTLSTALPDA